MPDPSPPESPPPIPEEKPEEKPPADARTPDTLWQALLHLIWRLPNRLRIGLLLLLTVFVAGLAVWATMPDSAKERFLGVKTSAPASKASIVTETDPQPWQPTAIVVVNEINERVILECTWHDIVWVGSEGWLVGAREEGGGTGQFLGRGILLHTVNGGDQWHDITGNVVADSGQVAIFPQTWQGVGPITAIDVYPRLLPSGKRQMEGWFASWTGIYTTEDAANGTWRRMTPDPSQPPGYAHFQRMAGIEAYRELYAVGWQGIAHWARSSGWQLQFPTHYYLIQSVFVFGDTQRDVWAVGRAGTEDEHGKIESDSRGAIYHLLWPENRWQEVQTGIALDVAQTFRDIIQLDYQTVVAVGDRGLILRGRHEAGRWTWTRSHSDVDVGLNALGLIGTRLFAVGDDGTIMTSTDQGSTWASQKPLGAEKRSLFRIRAGEREMWIVGDRIVLKTAYAR